MKQALHIFRKDFRYLRVAIALLMALAAATIVEQGFDQVFAVAAAGVIVLLIHAERIPGSNVSANWAALSTNSQTLTRPLTCTTGTSGGWFRKRPRRCPLP